MLAELLILLASCDANGVALGACGSPCPGSSGASYTICAEQPQSSTLPGVGGSPPAPKPMRLCSYYVNGTIDTPTFSVITAWIEVGSRACIGDPEPVIFLPRERTFEEVTMDAFTAYAIAPFAYLSPSGEAEITEPVSFGANLGGGEHSGELFGKMANIRFVAIGTKWSFSDGQRLSGQFVTTSFELPELVTASAEVSYRIDYRYPGESWVLNAATASLTSNQLSLSVVDPPRRTLLIA